MTHAIDWGQYGDLQRGDYARSAAWIETLDALLTRDEHDGYLATSLPSMKARHIVETREWATRPITEESPAHELYATGLSAVQLGDLPLAERAASGLAAHAEKAAGDDSFYHRTAQPLAIMAKQVSGTLAIARGDTEAGLTLLAEAVAITEAMPLPRGPANPAKPAHELDGEALLAAGRADDAMAQFRESLLRMPNRPLSVLGLARATAARGDRIAARESYARLAEIWDGRDFPELEEWEPGLARDTAR
jgi:tetratricopeptide (TPR) repeat protein